MKKSAFLAALVAVMIYGVPAVQAETTNPAEQVALLNAINQHEIDAAKEAQNRNVSAPVKAFAQEMITAHEENMQQTTAVASQAGVNPENTASVKAFQDQGKQKLDALKQLDDAQFAQRYAQEMVAGHEDALKKIDAFIPNAQGALKDHLTKTREKVQMHLQHAQQLTKSL